MNYHIGTMLIKEHFDGGKDCPVCRIKHSVDVRLTEQYLGEGVMEDHTRAEVNELGFCRRHFSLLYSMRSKLGLALQASTITNTVMKDVEIAKNTKQAKKQAQKILDKGSTCVICKYLDEHLIRYYKTIAEVYSSQSSFKDDILSGNGFCEEHYARLLEYSAYAGGSRKEYLKTLYTVQIRRLSTLSDNLLKFCDRHDYRRAGQPMGDEKYALKDFSDTFYGLDDK